MEQFTDDDSPKEIFLNSMDVVRRSLVYIIYRKNDVKFVIFV
jgi:hypothetical protein